MQPLQVTPDGLRAQAARCQALAGKLGSNGTPAGGGTSQQASAIAAAVCRERADSVGSTLAAWTQAMASKLTTAASAYERQDTDSATELATKVV